MRLYTVYENGTLRVVKKVDFAESKVYLIDDYKTIYLWLGIKASKKKRDFGKKKAEILNKKKKIPVKITVLEQNKEFGAFLAIIDVLKKGIDQKKGEERRSELELQVEDTQELVEAGLDLDLEAEITLKAHEISQQGKSYEELCRYLAELQFKLIEGKKKTPASEIKKKEQEIFKSSSTYEELCWLIAEIQMMIDNAKSI